eukprot:163545_1
MAAMSFRAPSVCASTRSFVDTTVGREYFYEAKRLLSEGKYLQCKRLFKFVIQLRPDAASPHFYLGCTLVELSCLEEAISHFKKAVRLKPEVVKYRQFEKWYSGLYQVKYQSHVTPGGPDDGHADPKHKLDKEDDEESKDKQQSHHSHEEVEYKDEDEDVYGNGNEHKKCLTHLSVRKLLNEFAPNTSEYRLKPNATIQDTIKAIQDTIKLYEKDSKLYQLLIHHKDVLVNRRKQDQIRSKTIKNFKKHSKCRYCFVPLSVACKHQVKRKKKMTVCEHKYYYMFE